ncbi:branched-chain amino acid ABC transporter permease [Magnetospira sp. QH-2]|uniref:branched-chain amino acid ABC transporter permease n=1 Tax=Magnetospira sp. (strain QH-2) TaxID=1288970 RepID=UPI0003E80ADC|nr:branched-chain amino acid ABC transporter permease [Magnetospira sp. QH-2]CCQ73837.1 Putative high-affinity branched-chain amino acid transport system permease protein LivM [Magnetospira sp. QH-2]
MEGLLGYFIFFLTMAGIYAVLTLALNMQWGFTGQFNIGIAGFFAIGAYTGAIFTTLASNSHLGGFDMPFLVGVGAALLVSGIVAFLIGLITARLRTDYLAIATIGIAEIIRHVLKNEDWLTNGVRGIPAIPRPVEGEMALLGVVIAFVVLVYVLIERARRSPWGRVLRAIRENENATLASGKDVTRFRLEAFVVGSAIMGVGGALYAHFLGFISPEAFDPLYGTFLVWVMLIAGGSGNNKGAVLGAVVIWGLWSASEILTSRLPVEYVTQAGALRVLLIGVVLQIILLFRPEGLIPEEKPKLGREAGE